MYTVYRAGGQRPVAAGSRCLVVNSRSREPRAGRRSVPAVVSRHFLPERVEVVEALPKTPSGKVCKVELRARYSG
jgi:acyl-coenzyme A synthetase/AMP-(fatty) acid ligase